jgi:hypothetical protein
MKYLRYYILCLKHSIDTINGMLRITQIHGTLAPLSLQLISRWTECKEASVFSNKYL